MIKCSKCLNDIKSRNAIYLLECNHAIHIQCKPKKEYNCIFCREKIHCKICKKDNYYYKLLLSP